jgi:putative heme-binding domain-containing protein
VLRFRIGNEAWLRFAWEDILKGEHKRPGDLSMRFGRLLLLALFLMLAGSLRADDSGLAPLVQVLAEIDDAAVQLDLLTGMREGLKGRQSVAMPEGWAKAYTKLAKSSDAKVRDHARALAIVFGDRAAIEEVKTLALATKASAAERSAAIDVLVDKRLTGLAPLLQKLLDDSNVRRAALRGLAAYHDEKTAVEILARYSKLNDDEKQDALATLTSRKEYALALVSAVEKKSVPRADLLPVLVRQMHALNDAALSAKLKEVWGEVRETPQDKLAKIKKYTEQLTPAALAKAELANGRKVFQKTCQQCHTLYGEGAKIGPDLTGSNRSNLEYVLTNVIDPSAAIAREYRMNIVVTTDGRVLTGMIIEKSGDRITLQTVNEKLTLVAADIEELTESPLSMMPEGQFDALSAKDVRDLVGYLATKKQIE